MFLLGVAHRSRVVEKKADFVGTLVVAAEGGWRRLEFHTTSEELRKRYQLMYVTWKMLGLRHSSRTFDWDNTLDTWTTHI